MTTYNTIGQAIKTKLETISGLTVYLNRDKTAPVDENVIPYADIRIGEDNPNENLGAFGSEVHKMTVQIIYFEHSGASPDTTVSKINTLGTQIFDKMNTLRGELITSFTIEDMTSPTRSSPENGQGSTLFIAQALSYDIFFSTNIYGES